LGFGTSGLHHLLRSKARQELLAAAFDMGIRHYDTSPLYGHGIAERELGKFVRGRRGAILLATKFGLHPNPVFERFPCIMYAQLSANAVRRRISRRNRPIVTPRRDFCARVAQFSLERSLRAMRSDYVDIYFLHEPCGASVPISDELVLTLGRLQQAGKFRYLGLAGAAHDCIEVMRYLPSIGQIIQVNAAPGAAAFALLRQSSLPCHFSYGHFRGRTGPIDALLREALSLNQSGVILYSSRHPTRLAQVASRLPELDQR
jgi:aryl-alcohol dehydrogenase-like predicted oxidoreductase